MNMQTSHNPSYERSRRGLRWEGCERCRGFIAVWQDDTGVSRTGGPVRPCGYRRICDWGIVRVLMCDCIGGFV